MKARQSGVVLIGTLITLVFLTLVAITVLRTSVLELKIGGAHHIAARNLAYAESALRQFMNDNQAKYSYDTSSFVINGQKYRDYVNDAGVNNYTSGVPGVSTKIGATLIACAPDTGELSGNSAGSDSLLKVVYELTAKAEDSVFSGLAVVHQGVAASVAGTQDMCLG